MRLLKYFYPQPVPENAVPAVRKSAGAGKQNLSQHAFSLSVWNGFERHHIIFVLHQTTA
jgi:hypothetical protein